MNSVFWVSEHADRHVHYRTGHNDISDDVGECE